MAADIPVIMTTAGAIPTAPADLRAQLIALATADDPGLTTDLPASLLEDLSSTAVGGLVVIDQARVDAINSITPFGANDFVLNQLGGIYGVQQQAESFTSVSVVFTVSPATGGVIIPPGFVVSDGTHQYTVQDGGITTAEGTTAPLFCVATTVGTWAVAENTVTEIVTSAPSSIGTLTVTNPTAGTPGTDDETEESYRASVLQGGNVTSVGTPGFLKTLLGRVNGVQKRLISVRKDATTGKWEVICGGGDPYQVAYAVYQGVADPLNLVGSTLSITAITQANPGVATTELNHGLTTGDMITISGSNPSNYNATNATVTVIDEKTFTYGLDTSAFGAYVSGGVVTPNDRNVVVTVKDFPDTYQIPFVDPPQQTVTMTVTWNTTATNFIADAAIEQAAVPALVDYVNTVAVGQPMNVFELNTVFQTAVANVLPPELLTRLVFAVSINGVGTNPVSGTGVINGDPESYFFAVSTGITVQRG